MSTYAYVRVSSKDQNEDRQILALEELKIPKKNIYIDKMSGKDFNRPGYRKLIKRLKENDLLYIKSIDRLGRNYEEIIEQWKILTRDKKVDIVVLDMPLLDTRQGKDLLGTFISVLVLQVLSFVAENERTTIKTRQKEGIEAAKLRGVKFGRPDKNVPPEELELFISKEVTPIAIMEKYNICKSTFYKKVRVYKETRVHQGLP